MFSIQTFPKSFIKKKRKVYVDAFWVWMMNYGLMVLNYMDPTSFLHSTSERLEIYSCWAIMDSTWKPIFISYTHCNFIFLVKAYRLGLWIFFHSLIKFFFEWKKKKKLSSSYLFFFLNTSIQNSKRLELSVRVHHFFLG